MWTWWHTSRDRSSIWEIPVQELTASEEWKLSDVYDAKFIADIDGDEIGDIIASHTVQSRETHTSEILIISGTNGNIIHSSVLPKTEQLLLAPQKLVHPDGEIIFVFVTSSQKQLGGLYIVPQVNLLSDNLVSYLSIVRGKHVNGNYNNFIKMYVYCSNCENYIMAQGKELCCPQFW